MVLLRIKEYIDYRNISIAAFERSVGLGNATFGKSLKTGGAIGSDKLEKILNIYSDLNPTWLLTGKGDMLINNKEENSEQENKKNTSLEGDETHNYQSITEGGVPYGKKIAHIDPDFEKITKKDVEILQKVIENQFEELAELHGHITTLLNIISTLSQSLQNTNLINQLSDEKIKDGTKEISAIALK